MPEPRGAAGGGGSAVSGRQASALVGAWRVDVVGVDHLIDRHLNITESENWEIKFH